MGRVLRMLVWGVVLIGFPIGFVWYNKYQKQQRAFREESQVVGVDMLDLKKANPKDREVLVQAVGQIEAGQLPAALATLNLIANKDNGPVHLRAVLLSGRCMLGLENLAEAERLFEYVLQHQPNNIDAHRGLAAIYYDLGVTNQAEVHLKKVAELDPTDYRPYRLIGTILLDMKHFSDAEPALRNCLERSPPENLLPDIQEDFVRCLIGLKRFEDGLQVLPQASSPEGHALRAECLRNLDRISECEQEIEQGFKRSSNHRALWIQKGLLAIAKQDDTQAISSLEKALAEQPFDKETRYQLSQAYQRLGKVEEAKQQLAKLQEHDQRIQRVVSLNEKAIQEPWNAEVRKQLADACLAIQRPDLAAMWTKAAEQCTQKR